MKTKNVLFGCLLLLFLATFFFKVIPIPVESIEGGKDPNHFIYGGIYWTSILYELGVENYRGSVAYCFVFVILFTGNHFLFKRGKVNGNI